MTEDDRTSATGLARYAKEYYEAALAADKKLGSRNGCELIAAVPVMHLTAHSIELCLKAYLRYKKLPVSKMIKIGHDLDKAWKMSVENGIKDYVDLNDVELETLRLISFLHFSTQLRYIVTGSKTYPVFRALQDLTEKLLGEICPLTGIRMLTDIGR